MVPAVAFLAGLLLGGVFVALGGLGDDDDGRGTADIDTVVTDPPVPTTSASSDAVTVTVAGACLDAVEATEEVVTLGREAAAALTELDARELERIVDEMQQLEIDVRELADLCRQASSDSR